MRSLRERATAHGLDRCWPKRGKTDRAVFWLPDQSEGSRSRGVGDHSRNSAAFVRGTTAPKPKRRKAGGSPKRRVSRDHQHPENRCGFATCRRPVPRSSQRQPNKSCGLGNEAVTPADPLLGRGHRLEWQSDEFLPCRCDRRTRRGGHFRHPALELAALMVSTLRRRGGGHQVCAGAHRPPGILYASSGFHGLSNPVRTR
jgi:hypothetical protein